MEEHPQQLTPSRCRKKTRNVGRHKRSIAKAQRYTPKCLPEYPACKHSSPTGAYQCCTLTMKQIQNFHKKFYSTNVRLMQNALIMKYTQTSCVKRRRSTISSRKKPKFFTKYFVPTTFGLLPVCQKSFLKILGISRKRGESVVKQCHETGQAPQEGRGGDHRSQRFRGKRAAVIRFIKSLKCSAPHYCRGKSSVRRYLSSDLSINKLFNMYNAQCTIQSLKVRKYFFQQIFTRNFNLGFGTPATDACSTCFSLKERIKKEENNAEQAKLMMELRVHKLRAKAFFELVGEERDDLATFCFDCEKNLPLPKIPDQSTYYSRQLYLYNLTITHGCSKSKLGVENSFAYVWLEHEYAKNSNAIASALWHRLSVTDLSSKRIVRLCADGCSGQNKNSIVISAICKWLQSVAPQNIEEVELIFPVTGHSFLPPDRVFGNIEQSIRKKDTIENLQGYLKYISEFATVVKMGEDCELNDYKEATKFTMKATYSWPMGITCCKRFFIKRSGMNNVRVRGEMYYKTDLGAYHPLTKRGKTLTSFSANLIPKYSVQVKTAKLRDVQDLLEKHWGMGWRDFECLQFYKQFFDEPMHNNNDVYEFFEDEDEPLCCPLEEAPDLIV